MPQLILFNKPFNVLSQFTDESGKQTLSDFITVPGVYAAGRLDYDSEGLLLLTDYGPLNAQITQPANKLPKTYYAQVDGNITDQAIAQLEKGVQLKDGPTLPAKAKIVDEPSWLWPRCPPIRQRNNDITSWLQLTIIEGRNRQVRRMTAAVGFPTLRLIRYSVGPWTIDNLKPANSQEALIPETYLKRRPLRDLDTTRNRRHHHRRKR